MLAKKPLVVRAGSSLGSACSRARDRWCSLAGTVVLSRRGETSVTVLQVSRPGLTTPLPELTLHTRQTRLDQAHVRCEAGSVTSADKRLANELTAWTKDN